MESYSYKAFISYRHLEPDQTIAKKLHTMIENFRIPASIKKSLNIKKMGRVFRDQEELPLSSDLGNDIHRALENAEWLIVICSPRLLESRWCLEEINYFRSLGKEDHILTVLVEGEPTDSFPEVLCYQEIDGQRIPKEPLAADVRDTSISRMLKKLKTEKLRILAPMLDVHFDDLKQRTKVRRRRIITGVSIAAFVVIGAFLAYALIQNQRLEKERRTALDQQMKLLIEESNTEVSSGNKRLAEKYLADADVIRKQIGTENDELYKESLEYAVYSGSFERVLNIDSNNRHFGEFVFSSDDKKLLAITNVNSACMIDAETGRILYTVSRANTGMVDEVGFLDNDEYFYMVDSWYGFVSVYNAKDGSFAAELDMSDGMAWNIGEKAFALGGNKLLVVKRDALMIWDYKADTVEEILPASENGLDAYTQGLIVALSNDRKTIAVGSHGGGNGGFLYNLETGEKLDLAIDPVRGYYSLSFSGDDRYLGAISGTKYIVWDTQTGQEVLLEDFDKDGTMPDSITLSKNGSYAAVTGTSLLVKDVASGKTLWTMDADSNIVFSGVFSEDEELLSVSGGISGIFDTKSGTCISNQGGTVFSHDGRSLVSGSYENEPVLLSTPESATVKKEEGFTGTLYETERFTELAGSFQIYQNHVVGDIYTTGVNSAGRQAMAYTDPSASWLAYCYQDGFIEIYRIPTEADAEEDNVLKAEYAMAEHCYYNVNDVVFHDSLMASCGGYDPRCVLFDLETGSIRYVLPGTEYCYGSEFSPDGSKIILLCGQDRKTAPVYSTETGNLLFTLQSESPIQTIGFTEDGSQAVAVSSDGTAIIGELYTNLEALINRVNPQKDTYSILAREY